MLGCRDLTIMESLRPKKLSKTIEFNCSPTTNRVPKCHIYTNFKSLQDL